MLVVMTFVSLSVCQVNGAFHQVELVQARLSPRGRAISRVIFDVLAFGRSAPAAVAIHPARTVVLAVRRARADLSWRRRSGCRGSRWRSAWRRCASRCCRTLARRCAGACRVLNRGAGHAWVPNCSYLIVTVLFLGLLTAGMAVPFAIAVPAVIYLLLQGGFPALNGLGLMSWGSMNSVRAHRACRCSCSWRRS